MLTVSLSETQCAGINTDLRFFELALSIFTVSAHS